MTAFPSLDAVPDTTEALTVVPLTLLDRCDRCGAQAFVRTTHLEGELLWCGHHYSTLEGRLSESALTIQDERSRINEKPSQSSGVAAE